MTAVPTYGVDTVSSASQEETPAPAAPAPAPAAPAPAAPATPAPAAPAAPKASVAAPVGGRAQAIAGQAYVVVSGDVFWRIAKQHGLTIDALAKLNPQITDINRIYPGDKLTVKADSAAVATTPAATAPAATTPAAAKKLYHGFGEIANYRVRNGNNDNLNITTASVIFDENGKIIDLTWDVMEIMPSLFPGWLDTTLDQAAKNAFVAGIDGVWETKREEGYDYDMTHLKANGVADNLTKKEWFEQLDYFEAFFRGKTAAEVKTWFDKYTDANGRPYKFAYPEKLTDADKAATASFTAEEKAMLVDVTTSATMSLQDPHSHFISALLEAWEAREEIILK
ncbi:LysM peptidoglycan-binding domain-containing protein [Oxobacter pfennigii]|nr:LysM domain-containing protein [Oxobacter pfennigii]